MSSSDASERCRGVRKAGRVPGGRRGFTLIEVLAAVALLGILYAVLARVAIEGLRAEGDSRRRLEASLLADTSVAALFGAALPPIGQTETVDGDFTVRLDVTAFQMPAQWSVVEAEAAPPLLLTAARDGATQALRMAQITVFWIEGASERHVSRTTYLLDFQAVAALAAAAPQGEAPEATEEAASTEDPEQAPPTELELE